MKTLHRSRPLAAWPTARLRLMAASIAVVLLSATPLLSSCGPPPSPGNGGNSGGNVPISSFTLNLAPLQVRLDSVFPSRFCRAPRPQNRGCGAVCKPCVVFVCRNGQWQPEPMNWPEEICEPRPGIQPVACPRESGGFCPAECRVCVDVDLGSPMSPAL
jgi:hypothetical protein